MLGWFEWCPVVGLEPLSSEGWLNSKLIFTKDLFLYLWLAENIRNGKIFEN
jgi:hypothetical protein